MLGKPYYYIILFAGLLAGSMHPEGPVTSLLTQVFLVFLSKQILRWFPSFRLLLHASHAAILI
jgi:hypothetical protein